MFDNTPPKPLQNKDSARSRTPNDASNDASSFADLMGASGVTKLNSAKLKPQAHQANHKQTPKPTMQHAQRRQHALRDNVDSSPEILVSMEGESMFFEPIALRPEQTTHHQAPTLAGKSQKLLKKGSVDFTLDLHGMTQKHALVALDACIQSSAQRGVRILCIVHGKNTLKGASVLKALVYDYLQRHQHYFLGYRSVQDASGESGSVRVLLKKH